MSPAPHLSGAVRMHRAMFEGVPGYSPELLVSDESLWPEHYQWISCGTLYLYRHVGGGCYRVAAESSLELSDEDVLRGQQLYARHVEGFTDPGMADTSQPYFLDLITRIDDVTR